MPSPAESLSGAFTHNANSLENASSTDSLTESAVATSVLPKPPSSVCVDNLSGVHESALQNSPTPPSALESLPSGDFTQRNANSSEGVAGSAATECLMPPPASDSRSARDEVIDLTTDQQHEVVDFAFVPTKLV